MLYRPKLLRSLLPKTIYPVDPTYPTIRGIRYTYLMTPKSIKPFWLTDEPNNQKNIESINISLPLSDKNPNA